MATLPKLARHDWTAAQLATKTDTEAVQGIVGSMVTGAGGTYNDVAGSITLPRPSVPHPPTLQQVAITPTGSGPRFIEKVGDLLYGVLGATGTIYTSVDGTTWVQVNATWPGTGVETWISRIIPTADGEMLAMASHSLRKSSGWSVDPATATWSDLKVSLEDTCVFNGFGLDGDGQKFIITAYASPTWADSRYAYISLDAGETWSIAYDSQALHGDIAAPEESHIHGACYDPWSDRFYISEGHGPAGGIYSSADNGATWVGPMRIETRTPTATPNNGATVLMATDDGIVLGSDNPENGLFGILRRENQADERIIQTWRMHTGRPGLVAFAQRGWRDPATGYVYVTFRAEFADTPLTVAAGMAGGGGVVYELPTLPVTARSDRFGAVGTVGDGDLFLYAEIGVSPHHVRGTLTSPGSVPLSLLDTGYVLQGSAEASSVAVGRQATAAASSSVAVGNGAQVPGAAPQGVAVGYAAQATSSAAVACGAEALAGNAGVAIGKGASATLSTAVGFAAQAQGSYSTALGAATSTGLDGVAIGHGAKTTGWSRSVAIGRGVSATGNDQIALGARHIEVYEVAADPPAPATDRARLFVRDNGGGKTQLCIRFATGDVQVLATES